MSLINPDEIRMIDACVLQDGKPCLMKFITNQFEWTACSICKLYLAMLGLADGKDRFEGSSPS